MSCQHCLFFSFEKNKKQSFNNSEENRLSLQPSGAIPFVLFPGKKKTPKL
jgi:hypothetical protein